MKIGILLNAGVLACATNLVACGGSGTETQPQEIENHASSTENAVVTDGDTNTVNISSDTGVSDANDPVSVDETNLPNENGSQAQDNEASMGDENTGVDNGELEADADIDNSEGNGSDTNPGDVDSDNTSSALEAAGLGIQVYRKYQESTGNEIRRFRLNGTGQIAGIVQKFDLEALDTEVSLMVGDDPASLQTVLAIGNTLPEDFPSTVISGFVESTLGFGNDGTVAIVAEVTGARPGAVLVAGKPGYIRAIAKTGDTISPVDSQVFEIVQFGDVSVSGNGGVLFTAQSSENRQWVLLYDNGVVTTAIAHQLSSLLPTAGKPITETGNCDVSFRDDPIGYSQEFLYDYGTAFALQDNSLVFAASLSGACEWEGRSALVRYRNGSYESLVSIGQPIPGIDSTFEDGGSLVGVTPDSRLIVQAKVSRDNSADQPPTTILARKTDTLWEFPTVGNPLLIHGEHETVEILGNQTEVGIEGSIHYNNTAGVFAIRRVFDQEPSIFVGRIRNPIAYNNFDTLGASSLEYRVGVRDLLPPPYTGDNFFNDVVPAWILDDGRLLFYGTVQDAAANRLNFNAGLWMADDSGDLTEVITAGQELVDEEGNTVDFNFSPGINVGTSALLTNGSAMVEFQAAVVDIILKIAR